MINFTFLSRRWAGSGFIFMSMLILMSSCIGVTLTNEEGNSYTNMSESSEPAQLTACVGSSVTLTASCYVTPGTPNGTPYFVGSSDTFTDQGNGSFFASLPVTTTVPQTYTLDCMFTQEPDEGPTNLPFSFTILGVACSDRCTTVSASNLQASGMLGDGSCSVRITGVGTGKRFIFTGPNGYIFSNVFRSCGPHSIFADRIVNPGTYTLSVFGDGVVPLATYSIDVTGSACP